jgi:rubrerythrin
VADKPSYLGLLNGIACAEARAERFLSAWADATPDPDVRKALRTVVAREAEHAAAFAKRVNELGFEVRDTEDDKFEWRMEIATSDRSDLEKADLLGVPSELPDPSTPDMFDGYFRDHSIDIQTGELLGRYIAEERDTNRILFACAANLRACEVEPEPADDSERLVALEAKIDAACRAIEEVRQIVCAQTMPTPSA